MKGLLTLMAALGLVLNTSVAFAYKLKCPSSPSPILNFQTYDHDRFGTLPREIFLEYAAFVSSFDGCDLELM